MKVGIIGAGASGMMAAVTAAENGAEVTVFEKNDRVGKKILATGNGKCNISNLEFDMDKYYCDDKEKLHEIFSVFSLWDTIAFFESNGMMIRNKNGYLYPYSEQSSTVLDIFRKALIHPHIEIFTGTEIINAFYQEKKRKFAVEGKEESFSFDKLIVACGGPASLKKGEGMTGFRIAEKFGHTVHRLVPGLVQLKSSDDFLRIMAGVRCQARAELFAEKEKLAEEKGEIQFIKDGISGIPVFQFSRQAAYALTEKKKVTVKVNFFPDYEENAFLYTIASRYEAAKEATLNEFLLGTVNKKINMAIMKKEGYDPEVKISKLGLSEIKKLMQVYQNLVIHIDAANSMENAQVCAGGIDFSQVSTEMESGRQKGLYFTGELLDVDGKCGGYNLQWAWSSGYIAGRNAAGNSTSPLIYKRPKEEDLNVKN